MGIQRTAVPVHGIVGYPGPFVTCLDEISECKKPAPHCQSTTMGKRIKPF